MRTSKTLATTDRSRLAFAFGASAELADELGLLVLHGPKRATAGLLAAFEVDVEPLPRVGALSSVDNRFEWDEAEGDRSRGWWLEAHTRFFTRQCVAMELTSPPDIPVVFERLEMVWPTIAP